MKKISLVLIALVLILSTFSFSMAVNESADTAQEVITSTSNEQESELDSRRGNASKVTISRITKQEEKIDKATKDLGGDRTYGLVFYWLTVVKDYSIPVFFVLLTIASLNYFIIGNKKLDKREQGFKMIVTLIIGLIVFQVLPFLFAIIVAGR